MKKLRYYINWEYGTNFVNDIEVNKDDFFRLIDRMSMEFEIYKKGIDEDNGQILYKIRNYYDEWVLLGYHCYDKIRVIETLADQYYGSLET